MSGSVFFALPGVETLQFQWSSSRNALGLWEERPGRWKFDGWLYEGRVTSADVAREYAREYVALLARMRAAAGQA